MVNAPELVAFLNTLTTPDSEDWHVILDGKTVHIMAVQEDPTPMGRKRVSVGLFEVHITLFKKRVRLSEKGHRPLGCITVILCRDNLEAGIKLLGWLTRIARTKNFSVLSLLAAGGTAEAIERQRESVHYVPAGFTSISSLAEGRAACRRKHASGPCGRRPKRREVTALPTRRTPLSWRWLPRPI